MKTTLALLSVAMIALASVVPATANDSANTISSSQSNSDLPDWAIKAFTSED